MNDKQPPTDPALRAYKRGAGRMRTRIRALELENERLLGTLERETQELQELRDALHHATTTITALRRPRGADE